MKRLPIVTLVIGMLLGAVLMCAAMSLVPVQTGYPVGEAGIAEYRVEGFALAAQQPPDCVLPDVIHCIAITPTPFVPTGPTPDIPGEPTLTPTLQPTPTQVPTSTPVPITATNRFKNPGFETGWPSRIEDWPDFNGDGHRHKVPTPWKPWYCDGCPALRRHSSANPPPGYNPSYLLMGRPEYESAAFIGEAGADWREGFNAGEFFWFYRAGRGGYYQTVAVIPGATCEASFWVRAWSNRDNDPESDLDTPDDRANASFSILVDPQGGVDWQEALRSEPIGYQEGIYDHWAQITYRFIVPADSASVTVFIEALRLWPMINNNSYIDSASLRCSF